MGRHKAAVNCALLPWLSGKADCQEGRFLQIGNSFFLSKSFQALSSGAQVLYLCTALESGGRRKFTFPARTMKKYGIPARSGQRYISELVEKGFISCTCSGKNTRTDSEYEFVFDWKAV